MKENKGLFIELDEKTHHFKKIVGLKPAIHYEILIQYTNRQFDKKGMKYNVIKECNILSIGCCKDVCDVNIKPIEK